MAAQDPFTPQDPSGWLSPPRMPVEGFPYGAPAPSAPPMYELRPLTTSEVLDRTFSIYRSKFWLFAGIACFTSVLQSVVGGLQMFFQTRTLTQMRQIQAGAPPVMPSGTAASMILLMISSVLLFISASVTMAACVFALGETYLGRETSIKESFQATVKRWYAYIGIAFWQLGSFLWLPLVLLIPGAIMLGIAAARNGGALAVVGGILLFIGFTAGLVVGAIFGLRNAFGVPTAVLERLPVRQAMRRSKFLTDGTKWRIVLIGLITWALFFVVGLLQMPLAFITAMLLMKGSHAYITQALTLVINFVGYTVVTPVAMIGNSLLYFDQRVRKEAFDIAFLMGEERALEMHAPVQPVVSEPQITTQAVDATSL